MKTIPAIIATTLLLTSANAFAEAYTKRNDSNTLSLDAAQTRESAFQMGHNKLMQLQTLSSNELSRILHLHSSGYEANTLKLKDGGFVTVQEKMDASGKVSYVGLVKVDFSYLDVNTDG